jgi:glycosyltransferase involved in cell wall biosynthesis
MYFMFCRSYRWVFNSAMENTGGHLRIALVAPPYFDVPPAAYGGIEAVVADLADALVADGHAVTLVGAGVPGTSAAFVRTWDRLVPDRLGEPYPEIMNALLTRQAIGSIRGQIDVVHDHTTSGPLNAAIYARWGLPTVVTMHGPADDPDLRAFYGSLGSSIHLVAISHRQRVLAPELNWVGTVHNALRVDQWPFQDTKRGYALFLGRFSPDKGAHTALEAAHAAGVPLVLAGKCVEPLEKEYFADVVQPLLEPDDVVFGLADAQEKRLLLAHAQCLLFPVQWEEPFGMVMIEAMACGTPVVALAAGAVPEVVVDGVTGFICDAADQLPVAIKAVGELDPIACRAHVASRFSAAALARGYTDAYRRAITVTAAPRRVGVGRSRQMRPRTHAS